MKPQVTSDPDRRGQIAEELEAALRARRGGNEGKARVCARRAAGWAVGYAFEDTFAGKPTANAYLLLQWLADHQGAAPDLRSAADRLTARIDEEHELPYPEDPLEDANLIVERLMGDLGQGDS